MASVEEKFALAADRAQVIASLVPGTDDHFYFSLLHLGNEGKGGSKEFASLLAEYKRAFGESHARVLLVESRGVFQGKKRDEVLSFVEERLRLSYNDARKVIDKRDTVSGAPTRLEGEATGEALLKRVLAARKNDVAHFSPGAWAWLLQQKLTPHQRHDLLRKLDRRAVALPGIVPLVLDTLAPANGPKLDPTTRITRSLFGDVAVHNELTSDQLGKLLKSRGDLLQQSNFVAAVLRKMAPNPDLDLERNAGARRAYLTEVYKFTSKLGATFNTLKLVATYRLLELEMKEGNLPEPLFLAYLAIPRAVHYVNADMARSDMWQSNRAQFNNEPVRGVPLITPVASDGELVDHFLTRLMLRKKKDAGIKLFEKHVQIDYLRRLHAIGGLLYGPPAEKDSHFATLNDPSLAAALRERVDMTFAPENATYYGVDDPVTLAIDVKNVPTLLVKLFKINTTAFYKENLAELDTNINLDGLVANWECSFEYDEAPIQVVRREIEVPALERRRGVFVVELIGNGKSSRAVIFKGGYRYVHRIGAAGHVLTVVDEQNRVLRDAVVHMGTREFRALDGGVEGEIVVPFAASSASHVPILLTADGHTSLDHLDHKSETYALRAGFFVERSCLVRDAKATVVVRTALSVHDVPVSLALLEDVSLTVETMDADGSASKAVVADFALSDSADGTYEFSVPDGLRSVTFRLRASVRVASRGGEPMQLAADDTVQLNGLEATPRVDDLFLRVTGGSFVLALLGKAGEAKPDRSVTVRLSHRCVSTSDSIAMQTSAAGTIDLGPLVDVVSVTATCDGRSWTWPIHRDRATLPPAIHAAAGSTVTVPFPGADLRPGDASLVEVRGARGDVVRDLTDRLTARAGTLQMPTLAPGNYQLYLGAEDVTVPIFVSEGTRVGDFIVSDVRCLEAGGAASAGPVHVKAIDVGDKFVRVHVGNATASTRVHVIATHFVPAFDPFERLAVDTTAAPRLVDMAWQKSHYLSGRSLSDEYRYVIERQAAAKRAGNMLPRPRLLLDPWAVDTTKTNVEEGHGGDAYGRADLGGRRAESSMARARRRRAGGDGQAGGSYVSFLARPGVLLTNLRPDSKGVCTITNDIFTGGRCQLTVVAIDDASAAVRSTSVTDAAAAEASVGGAINAAPYQDTSLDHGLDPAKAFKEDRHVAAVAAGDSFVVSDVTTAKLEVYDSLTKVFGLFRALASPADAAKLEDFSFLLAWADKSEDERLQLFSKFASHELNFFLKHHDADFFERVVRPHLGNKRDKRFMDRWLLDEDLSAFRDDLIAYRRLNIVERVLVDAAASARTLTDELKARPRDVEAENALFRVALKSTALDTGDEMGLKAVKSQDREARARPAPVPMAMARSAAPMAPMAASAPAPPPGAGGGMRMMMKKVAQAKEMAMDICEEMDEQCDMLDDDLDGMLGACEAVPQMARDVNMRSQVEQLYQPMDFTKEFAETDYYNVRRSAEAGQLQQANAFWADYAAFLAAGGPKDGRVFVPTTILYPTGSLSEMLLALGVLHLPAQSAGSGIAYDGSQLTLTARAPMVVFVEEMAETEAASTTASVLVAQHVIDPEDPYAYDENNERMDKYVTDEFVQFKVYETQVVLTNVSSSNIKADVLLQIPVNACPVDNGFYTRTRFVHLSSHATVTLKYKYYFATTGDFQHFPVHVARLGQVIAAAAPVTFHVVDKATVVDQVAWPFVSQQGTNEAVEAFLAERSLVGVDLGAIAWRLKDKAVFERVLHLLRSRRIFDERLWRYAFKHRDALACREYLSARLASGSAGKLQLGQHLQSELLTIDAHMLGLYEHLEYDPLVNPRAHAFQGKRAVLNERLKEHWATFVRMLALHRAGTVETELSVVYYLLLMDRFEEALDRFHQALALDKAAPAACRMQIAYFRAYFAMTHGDFDAAVAAATPYATTAIPRWRRLFAHVLDEVYTVRGAPSDDVDMGEASGGDDETMSDTATRSVALSSAATSAAERDARIASAASAETALDFSIEGHTITIDYANLSTLTVSYFAMDLELLFSTQPFLQHGGSANFSSIVPTFEQLVTLPVGEQSATVEMPDRFRNANVYVQLSAGALSKGRTFYSHSLHVLVSENHGMLQVKDKRTLAPLARVYIKVFGRKTGTSQSVFVKDGYTAYSGRFDYASLSTNQLDGIDRLACLVMSEQHGSLIREMAPPRK